MAENSKTKAELAPEKALALTITQIEKDFGKGSIMCLGDKRFHTDVPAISTGAIGLDLALGIGGVPRGRIVEIYGPESSGKTTVCLHVIANAQKMGGTCAIIDAEHAIDPSYAERIGVDLSKLLISQPDSGEDALNIVERIVRTNAVDVIVIDSVAALVPKAELDGSMGDTHVGLQARLMSQALRKITGIVNRSNTCIIFTNQIRMKIGVMFGSPETTAGGQALKFYASIRMDIRRVGPIKGPNAEITGSRTRVKVVKNKMAAPFRTAEFDIMYAEGISWVGSLVEAAMSLGVFEKKGSWLFFDGVQVGQGKEQVKELIKTDVALQNKVLERINASEKNMAVTPDLPDPAAAVEEELEPE